MIVFDAEIIKAIPNPSEPRIPGIEYAKGWRDFENLGISVLVAYDLLLSTYSVFLEDNLQEFEAIAQGRVLCGFNIKNFDNELLKANGISATLFDGCYDMLEEIWKAVGLGLEYKKETHAGYSLDAIIKANFPGLEKTGYGALAPIWWQQRMYGKVINYCMNDVVLEQTLLQEIVNKGRLKDPKTGKYIEIEKPRSLISKISGER